MIERFLCVCMYVYVTQYLGLFKTEFDALKSKVGLLLKTHIPQPVHNGQNLLILLYITKHKNELSSSIMCVIWYRRRFCLYLAYQSKALTWPIFELHKWFTPKKWSELRMILIGTFISDPRMAKCGIWWQF